MTKWTKKEIKALYSTLKSFLLICRLKSGSHPEFADRFTARLNEKRKEIIIAGLRDDSRVFRNSAQCHREYVEHCKAHPEAFSTERSRLDLIAKTEALAADDEKLIVWFDKLISKVESEDLPSEVQEFNPLS